MIASKNGHIEIVRLLLDKGAKVNEQNNRGNNALIIASINGYTEIVKLLIDNGANIDLQNINSKDTA